MKILIIGQTSLHWGRMEYGNIGNFYVMEPFFKELRRVFPNSEIRTTIQMSEDFCSVNKIVKLPLELYYSWGNDDYLSKCFSEYGSALFYNKTGVLNSKSQYIQEVLSADLVIDMSGDVWGDNADYAGDKRFIIGLLKDRIAQLLNKNVVMIAGSPGPFEMHKDIHAFTKEVFENFSLVTNREPVSERILKKYGFDTSNVENYACPAFLFEGCNNATVEKIIKKEKIRVENQETAGFIICGWNMIEGPYSKWPRKDKEYTIFAESIEYIINELNIRVVLLSHNNGFELPPNFRMKHGRDFPIAQQLFDIVEKRGNIDTDRICLVRGIYKPKQMMTLINNLDMLVSGRVHGSVAGISQYIPTVMIDYGHEPKAHKVRGFAELVGIDKYVADPSSTDDLTSKIKTCWNNREEYKLHLLKHLPKVRKLARQNFERLRIYETKEEGDV